MAGGLAVARRVSSIDRRRYPITDVRTRLTAVALLVTLNGLDVLTTHRMLHLGGVEGNPLSQWLITHDLLGPAKAAIVIGIGLIAPRLPARRASSLALWVVVGFYVAVV